MPGKIQPAPVGVMWLGIRAWLGAGAWLGASGCRVVALIASAAALCLGCSDDGGSTSAAGAGGGASAAGSPGVIAGSGSTSGAGAGQAASGTSGGGGTTGFAERGVCGQRGESPVTADSFAGYEETYLIGDGGLGRDICVVRYDVARVGEAPAGCDDCAWTHEVEYRNPQVLVDVDGVCANSELGLDSAGIDAIDGSQAAYGFVSEYSGHVSVLMKYDDATGTWGPNGNANWSEETGILSFDRRDGYCGY